MDKSSTITALASRRPKWQYPQAPPTPRILHLPRRPRRRTHPKANAVKPCSQKDREGKLVALFDKEREFARGVSPGVGGSDECGEEERRERVEERESDVVSVEEEKWRFQAEMLRAECNLLRMERDIAVKKMERRRVQMERILKSCVESLLSGRKKMREGKDASVVLEEEIQELAEKLEKLQRRTSVKDLEVRKCSNFDRQASLLRRRLEKFGGESGVEIRAKEIQEMAEASLSIGTSCTINQKVVLNRICNMEILRRKMDGLSKGNLLERIEDDYASVLSTSSSCASTLKQLQIEPDMSSSSIMQPCKETKWEEEIACSGCCKAIVRRVVEQIRSETEQWSQMQEMLGQVRDEIEELQASRDFWEDRALDSDHQIQSLRSAVQEWKQKAVSSEVKANELRVQVSALRADVERLRRKSAVTVRTEYAPSFRQESPDEMEKRVLVCRLKENRCTSNDGWKQKQTFADVRRPHPFPSSLNASKRSPFREIENSVICRHQQFR